ncbi:carotenoid 1,2-hydratase [Aeromonas hydrophila]|uniref:lipocalin-like domain-containing protein n=1 Tax=Aeromonas hydrophila TaxID=644 RepID=UPI0022AF6ABF|nr:lipocalin-like domain-containing protein [Aeromonas hydrophila]ELB2793132.1 carotenoid 1,2-hydratase [Aeromonas hydrophila]MCZ4331994.1 carotenoid 1,2-hydratase [Aeromonas hydrophila]
MKTFNIWSLALICTLYGAGISANDLGAILGGGNDHFKKALPGQSINLPTDHGAHPDYRSEWWYLTGNLKDEQGRGYGMQWTLFRQGIEQEITSDNPWLTPQLWLAQFAITDVSKGRHQQDERTSRQGPGLAGASGGQYWLKEWVLASQGEALFPATLKIQSKAGDLDLQVSAAKPAVLQGKAGYSEKSPGNASFYYSYPRLTISGTLTLDGETRNVSGEGWFDHEWSSSVLAQWQSGWDWFSLQFEDGRELMLFRLRTKSGHTEPENRYGILIERDGSSRVLNPAQIRLTSGKTWRGPKGQAYPIEWQLEAADMRLTIQARQPNQAMTGRFDYWEGAVTVEGDAKGVGYLEMTGY